MRFTRQLVANVAAVIEGAFIEQRDRVEAGIDVVEVSDDENEVVDDDDALEAFIEG